jgi:crotonobetainyl-CoA:carnitine CoA-transferase CaiB-like acyl-CoA transferase
MSGFLSLFVQPDDPRVAGPAISDAVTGLYAAYGILGALYERQTTGRGRLVEVSMLEATMNFGSEPFHHYFVSGKVPGPRDRAKVSQSYAFECADGMLICVHLSSPAKFWKGFLTAIEREDLAGDPRFAGRMDRVHNHEALNDTLRPIFRERNRDEWMRRLGQADVPHAPILRLDEVMADPQVRHSGIERELVHPTEGKVRTLRRPVIYDGDRDGIEVKPPPLLDEHGVEIRARLSKVAKSKTKKPKR